MIRVQQIVIFLATIVLVAAELQDDPKAGSCDDQSCEEHDQVLLLQTKFEHLVKIHGAVENAFEANGSANASNNAKQLPGIGGIIDNATSAVTDVIDDVTDVVDDVTDAVQGVTDTVALSLVAAVDTALSALEDVVQVVVGQINATTETFVNSMQQVAATGTVYMLTHLEEQVNLAQDSMLEQWNMLVSAMENIQSAINIALVTTGQQDLINQVDSAFGTVLEQANAFTTMVYSLSNYTAGLANSTEAEASARLAEAQEMLEEGLQHVNLTGQAFTDAFQILAAGVVEWTDISAQTNMISAEAATSVNESFVTFQQRADSIAQQLLSAVQGFILGFDQVVAMLGLPPPLQGSASCHFAHIIAFLIAVAGTCSTSGRP